MDGYCEWCGAVLPDDGTGRTHCSYTHATNARKMRKRPEAWRQHQARLLVCVSKVRHPTPRAAEKAIRATGGIGTAYACGDHWHTTRRPVNAGKDWRRAFGEVP